MTGAALFLIIAAVVATGGVFAADLAVDRIGFRLNYVKHDERLQRVNVAAEGNSFSTVGAPDGIKAQPTDTIVVRVSCVDDKGEPAYPQQAFLRFVDVSSGVDAEDTIFVLAQKNIEMRKEISLRSEISADKRFWRQDATYRVEVIVGDVRLPKGIAWVVTEAMTFDASDSSLFKVKPRGVFDFDVGIKKKLLPEFITPLPPTERKAPSWIVFAFTIASLLPLCFLVLAWVRLGVFPLQFPTDKKELICWILFEICLLCQVAALIMFWLKWNIVRTWQVIGVLMIPTLFFGHHALAAKATRDAKAAKVHQKRA